MSKKIIAKINKKTGGLEIKTEGYSGGECEEATRQLEQGLGMDQACSVPTPEMYQQVEEKIQHVDPFNLSP